jgi:hypothetical protein
MATMAAKNGLTAEERLEKAHQWYLRLGFPLKAAMKEKVVKTAGCDISVDDIGLLPWNKTGTRVDMQQLLLSISMHSTAGSYPDQSESTGASESFHSSGDGSFAESESEAAAEEAPTETETANNHPTEYHICNDVLDTLGILVEGSLYWTRHLMRMDAVTVASRALEDWPADSDAHAAARRLLGLFVSELKALLNKDQN